MSLLDSQAQTIHRGTDLLAPWFATKLEAALEECKDQGYPIAIFETYRSPSRQEYLYAQGRTRPGKKVTNAKSWQSAHQFGLACDLAFFDGRKWSWDGPWDKVHAIFHEHGFETLDFEKPHVQIMRGLTFAEAYKICRDQGLLAVWSTIEMRI